MANNIPVTKAWVDNLGQTVREGKGYGQIIGKAPLTPEEYALQNARYDIERVAQMERPTYGMWNGKTFISTDPNEIAEINANAEMRRTGLDRYYHPNSAAYYAAFQGIRDKYLQQEMAKKAAIENEGKQLYANRMGAFDKMIADQYKLKEEQIKGAGLESLRKAQEQQALAIAENNRSGDGLTKQQRISLLKDNKAKLAAMADDSRTQLLEKINDPATSTKDRATYIDAMNKINTNLDADFALMDKNEEPRYMKEFFKWQAFPQQYKPAQQGLAGVHANTAVRPIEAKNITLEQIDLVKQGKGKIIRNRQTGSVKFVSLDTGNEGENQNPPPPKVQKTLQEEQTEWENAHKSAVGNIITPFLSPKEKVERANYWKIANEKAKLAEIERVKKQKANRIAAGLD